MQLRSVALFLALATVVAAQTTPPAACPTGPSYFETMDANGAVVGTPGEYPGGWIDGGGNHQWWVNTGQTSSGGTGPFPGDHTSGTGQYLYMEGSSPIAQGDTAIINAPVMRLAGAPSPTVDVWVSMRGDAGMGDLFVEEFDGTMWVTVASLSGNQGSAWVQLTAPLAGNGAGEAEVRFRAVRGSGFRSDIGIDDVAICGTPIPLYQVNTPENSVDINGAQVPTNLGPKARVETCIGAPTNLNFNSTLGGDTEILLDFGFVQPNVLAIPGDQTLNIDFLAPTFFGLNSGTSVPQFAPYIGNVSLPLIPIAPATVSIQQIMLDPSLPALLRLSQATELETITPLPSIAGPQADDSFLRVEFVAPPLCGPSSVAFYGTLYTDMYVSSNGRITMNGGNSLDFAPTIAEAMNGFPLIAPGWADLSPQVTNGLNISATPTSVTVDYANVPQWANTPFGSNDFRVQMDVITGEIKFENLNYDPSGTAVMLIALSPGGPLGSFPGATDPGPVDFTTPGGGFTLNPTDMIYQIGNIPTFSGITEISFLPNVFSNYDYVAL